MGAPEFEEENIMEGEEPVDVEEDDMEQRVPREPDAFLAYFSAEILSGSLRRTQQAVEHDLRAFLEDNEGSALAKPQTRTLIKEIRQAADHFAARDYQGLLLKATGMAIISSRCPDFDTVFANVFTEVARGSARTRSSNLMQVTIVLEALSNPDMEVKDELIERLLTASLPIVDASTQDDVNRRKNVLRSFEGVLARHDALLNRTVKLATSEKGDGCGFQAIRITLEQCLRKGNIGEHKSLFLASLVRTALLNKVRPSARQIECYRPLLAAMSHEEFGEEVLPHLTRVIKKNPDTVLEAVAVIVECLSLDVSRYAMTAFVPVCLTKLRSQNESVRAYATQLVAAVAKHISDAEVVLEIIRELKAVLSGKQGVLAQFYQRAGIFSALNALQLSCQAVSSSASRAIATAAVEALIPAINKEAHEETRRDSLLSLGRWLRLLPEVPDPAVEMLSKNLKTGPKASPTDYLRCALLAIEGTKDGNDCSLKALVPCLLNIIGDAAKKSTVAQYDGVLSLSLLLKISALDKAAESAAVSNKVFDQFTTEPSFLYNKMLLDTQSTSSVEQTVVASLVSLSDALSGVVIQFPQYVSGLVDKEGYAPYYKLLVSLATHTISEVRTRARTSIKAVVRAIPEAGSHVIGTMHQAVLQLSGLAIEARTKVREEDDSSKYWIPTPEILSAALRATLQADSPLSTPDAVAKTFLLSHHPLLERSDRDYGRQWRTSRGLLLRAEDPEAEFDKKLRNVQLREAITALLLSEEGLYSVLDLQRKASHRALGTLLKYVGEGNSEEVALTEIFPTLRGHIGSVELLSLSSKEIGIFLSPEGELYNGDEESGVYQAQVVVSRHLTEDEKWEQQVREELQKKKNAANAAGKTASAKRGSKGANEEEAKRAKKLEEQNVVRERVHGLVNLARFSLDTVASVCLMDPEDIHSSIPGLLSPVLKALKMPLVAQPARDALWALCRAVHERLRDISIAIASALRLATLQPSDIPQFPRSFQKVIEALLLLDKPIQGCDSALTLIAAHCRIISEDEEEEPGDADAQRQLRKPLISLLLSVLAKHPKAQPPPDQLLARVCAGPSLSLGEWQPLLSDSGILAPEAHVRFACLRTLLMLQANGMALSQVQNPLLVSRMWLARYDLDEQNQTIAEHVWEQSDCEVTTMYAGPLIALLSHESEDIREAVGKALGDAILESPETSSSTTSRLLSLFRNKIPPPPPPPDPLDIRARERIEIKPEDATTWVPRHGVSLALESIAKAVAFSEEDVQAVIHFIVEFGLGDSHERVRAQMLKAGIQLIDSYGKDQMTTLLPLLEGFLNADAPPAESEEVSFTATPQFLSHSSRQPKHIASKDIRKHDAQREGVVVLLGSLAKHMKKEDPKVAGTVNILIQALGTPSESVQRAVSSCLFPLVPSVREKGGPLLDSLLEKCLGGPTYGDRRGAAYGIAAVVKGLGIASLKQHNIISRLEAACSGKSVEGRQGSLFAFELLCARLGILFEPYVIVILPSLLRSFSDNAQPVRDAAHDASRAIMGNLSGHGVKLVLPTLLRSLEDDQWRTKQAAIQLLGAMAYCAPKQLGSCLPQIVPRLSEALTDSHPKVRAAGKLALDDVGSVIRNPEISALSPVILAALIEPSVKTAAALEALQSTAFVHSIDAPSLALIIPVVMRGLKDRGTDTKKTAALIVGNMCTMINEPKDILPYVPVIMPLLKGICVDPIPDVRGLAAKSIGMLVRGLGEEQFPDLLGWLLDTTKSESSSVERSGAAQALCEVLVALGADRLNETLDELLPLSNHPKSYVREGVMWTLAFLPNAMGRMFASFIPRAMPIIVEGLADESDMVREVAMRAGQVLVNAHSLSNTNEILPTLEEGLFDDNWRIRQSSVMLLGDFLYRLGGVRAVGMAHGDEDDDAQGSHAANRAIIKALGMERRNAVIASLYMIRSDTSAVVRQSALQVWKSIIANTPKTLREILPTLVNSILTALSSVNVDKRLVAGRTLGDLVRKLGDRVLPEIIPIFRSGLKKDDKNLRQGVCLGLSEVLTAASKKQLEEYLNTIVLAVQDALCDPVSEVRESAAKAFQTLQKSVGARAADEIVPTLLAALESGSAERSHRALKGLQEVLALRSKEVLPALLPKLLARPYTIPHMQALGAVAEVTGSTIHFYLEGIFNKLLPAVAGLDGHIGGEGQKKRSDAESKEVEENEQDEEVEEAMKSALCKLVTSVQTVGVHWLVQELLKAGADDRPELRKAALWLLGEFFSHTKAEILPEVPLVLRELLLRLTDSNTDVLMALNSALLALNKAVRPEELVRHLDFTRNHINSIVSTARHRKGGVGEGEFLLPGFCIKRGLEPLLPLYQQGLMYGSPEVREAAAQGLGELVAVTSEEALKPFLIKITGPLIRIVGDRFPWQVKAAILDTLALLLSRGGVHLKAFLPQLQTTFIKALNDSQEQVRRRGAAGLARLMRLSPRVDPVVAELLGGLSHSDRDVRAAMISALSLVLKEVGSKVSAQALRQAAEVLSKNLDNAEDDTRQAVAGALGCAIASLPENEAIVTLERILQSEGDYEGWQMRHGLCATLYHAIKASSSLLSTQKDDVIQKVASYLADDKVPVKEAACRCVGVILLRLPSSEVASSLMPGLVSCLNESNSDVRKSAVRAVKKVAKRHPEVTRPHLSLLVPPLLKCVKEILIALKLAAERALLYVLEVHSRPETLQEYLKTCSPETSRFLADYGKRVLARLKADSGGESDEE